MARSEFHQPRHTWRNAVETALGDAQVRVSLVTAAALILIAVVAKNVLDAELDIFSQLAPLWVFIVFEVTGLRDRTAEIAAMTAVAAVTAGVLILYAT